MKSLHTCAFALLALIPLTACIGPGRINDPNDPPPTEMAPMGAVGDKWVRIEANLLLDTDSVESLMTVVRNAKAVGADTVLFSDTKASNWYAQDYGDEWLPKMLDLQQAVRDEGMGFVVTTASVGYCSPILQIDPSLVSSIPASAVPMTVRGGALVADDTANLVNGSFEASSSANVAADWDFQDEPGVATFLDTDVAADGGTSMRFEGSASSDASNMARASTTATVAPNQQYVLRFNFRAENLTNGFAGPIVYGAGSEIALTSQQMSLPYPDGGRNYFLQADDVTTEWTEMELAFNSREFDAVTLYLGSWDTEGGKMWVDDVRIDPAPTLNVVRRDTLPLTLTKVDGTPVVEGVDVTSVVDPLLGQIAYQGNYGTYHDGPTITAITGGNLVEGDKVLMNAYNAQITTLGQVGCSWNEQRTIDLMREMHRQVATVIQPDGILIDFEEVRNGGWEPTDALFTSTGVSLSAHIQRALDDANDVAGDRPIFIWSDMVDPTANARADFYQVKGDLSGAWIGIDPNMTRIVNWRAGSELSESGPASVKHFADLGFEQIVAGYYDEDVTANHSSWVSAMTGQPGIIGSMYTTWYRDFTKLNEFASLWWTG